MKKLTLTLACVVAVALQSFAHGYGHARINSYADAFVFDEMGVTFSVYPDGEFDFYLADAQCNSTVSNGFVDVTFNSGYNYNPYVQYDDFGAVVQVENVPVFYDYYGRVSQIGDVLINYRNRRVCQVGGLQVFYNRHGHYAYHTGFINVWNPYFVYRPFYVAFARPVLNMCFVRTTPYRQYYRPMRYTYYRPYVRNVRPAFATIGRTYRPSSGYGRVHARYSQTPRANERAVVRNRRKITTASVQSPRQAVSNRNGVNRTRTSVNGNASRRAVSPSTSRSQVRNGRQANERSARPVTRNVNTNSRTVQTKPSTTRNVSSSNRNVSSRKPASAPSRSTSVRSTSRVNSSSRSAVQPSQINTRSAVQKPTSRSSRGSGSRSSVSSRRTQSKPVTRSVSSRSSTRGSSVKSKSSGQKSGGQSVVGFKSSKRGR